VVRLEARLEKRVAALEALEQEALCDRGDVGEYRRLLEEAETARRQVQPSRRDLNDALLRLKPGDVIHVSGGRNGARAAVLSFAQRAAGAQLKVVTDHRKVLTLGTDDFDDVPSPLGPIDLPVPYAPNNHGFQQQVARKLQRTRLRGPDTGRRRRSIAEHVEAVSAAERHPVARCPDRDAHVRAVAQLRRLRSEVEELQRSVKGRTESLARRFDRVLRLLDAWGYLDGWALSAKGEQLAHLYHECDLLISETLAAGILDDLDPASLAALASVFTYEHRSSTPPPAPWFPSGKVRERYAEIERLGTELQADEHRAGLTLTRMPDPGFVAIAHAWAAGEELDDVLEDEDLSGGDFVRNVKQLIDLLRQIGQTSRPQTAHVANQAADQLLRGVVVASSMYSPDDHDD
jgi:ATP-dependent RNA helicase HelY